MVISYHKIFQKKFSRLDKKIKTAFKIKLALFLENPRHPLLRNHSVEKAFPGCRSLNITGDYRTIFRESTASIEFINIGTHSQLYR